MTQYKQTPSQTVGPYFAYGLVPEQYNFDLKSLFTASATDREVPGEHIAIVGNVYDANEASPLATRWSKSPRLMPTAATCRAWKRRASRAFAAARMGTDPKLRYVVYTVKPGATADDSTPHLDVILLMRGMLLHKLHARIYFDDEEATNAKDTVLQSVPAERRHTLIAKREMGSNGTIYRFDMHLRGPNETVFFDL